MCQRFVLIIALLVIALTGLPGTAAQEVTPEGAMPAATPPTDWLAEWAPGQTATINGAEIYFERLSPEPERFDELLDVLEALYMVEPNYSEAELQSIPLPVLILDGVDDEDITPDQPQRMAALIPDATLVIMPGTGHFAPFAKPALFSQIVLDYLDGKALALAATPVVGTPAP